MEAELGDAVSGSGALFARPVSLPTEPTAACDESVSIEVSGKVKSFNYLKGYGFIFDLVRGLDFFVHLSVARASGFAELPVGSMVRGLARLKGERGPIVDRILEVDESTAERAPLSELTWTLAHVRYIDADKETLFLSIGERVPRVLVSASVLAATSFGSSLQLGDRIGIRYREEKAGLLYATALSDLRQ
ncbi:MAG: cold shock domain-containing protein [Minisyncoccia bacterium]